MTEYPSPEEAATYAANNTYIRWLLSRMGSGDGLALERVAHYVLGCVPGFRARMRTRSKSTDYDVICASEGPVLDFRSELGRYFLCECKDWDKPANVTAVVKFARGTSICEMPFRNDFLEKRDNWRGQTGACRTGTSEDISTR